MEREGAAWVLSSTNPTVVAEGKAILEWLVKRPAEWELYVALAQIEKFGPQVYVYHEGAAIPGQSRANEYERRVKGFLASAAFGPCAECFFPVVIFPDFTTLDWPTLGHHNHGRDGVVGTRDGKASYHNRGMKTGLSSEAAVREPLMSRKQSIPEASPPAGSNPARGHQTQGGSSTAEQRPPKPHVGGSNPPRPATPPRETRKLMA